MVAFIKPVGLIAKGIAAGLDQFIGPLLVACYDFLLSLDQLRNLQACAVMSLVEQSNSFMSNELNNVL